MFIAALFVVKTWKDQDVGKWVNKLLWKIFQDQKI